MSIRTVNAGILNPTKLLDVFLYFEGPPFYSQLRLKLTISGSRSHTDGSGITRAETLSFTKEVTLDRVPMELAGISPTAPAPGSGPANDGFDAGEFTLSSPASGYFSVGALSEVPTKVGWQIIDFFYDASFTSETCGTWSETGHADPADDDSGDLQISFLPSGFAFWNATLGYPEYLRAPADRWGTKIILPSHFASTEETVGQDISAWSNAQWRSKLGVNSITYNETEWYDTGATTDVTATFEWELS